jgi:integrase
MVFLAYERRSVPIPPALADELAALLVTKSGDRDASCAPRPRAAPCATGTSCPVISSLRSRPPAFRRACVSTLAPHVRGLLINADPPAHPLAVIKRLGHSSMRETYNTYGHLFPTLDEALTTSVDRAYPAAQIARHASTTVTDVGKVESGHPLRLTRERECLAADGLGRR